MPGRNREREREKEREAEEAEEAEEAGLCCVFPIDAPPTIGRRRRRLEALPPRNQSTNDSASSAPLIAFLPP